MQQTAKYLSLTLNSPTSCILQGFSVSGLTIYEKRADIFVTLRFMARAISCITLDTLPLVGLQVESFQWIY